MSASMVDWIAQSMYGFCEYQPYLASSKALEIVDRGTDVREATELAAVEIAEPGQSVEREVDLR